MTVANVNANKISTIPRQCHPAAIAQMVMDGLRCVLGNAELARPEAVLARILLFKLDAVGLCVCYIVPTLN